LPPGFRLELAGSADRLSETVGQLVSAFVFSVVIIYLLWVALYCSVLLPVSGANRNDWGAVKFSDCYLIPGVIVPLDMITVTRIFNPLPGSGE